MGDCMGSLFSEKHGKMKMISTDRTYKIRLLEAKLTVPCFCLKWKILVDILDENGIQLTEYGDLGAER